MENLEVKIDIRETVKVEVDPRELLWAVNDLPIGQKWGAASSILDGINLNEELSDLQKEIIIKWLVKQSARFGLEVKGRKSEDSKMLDFLQELMTPAEGYCEIYLAGLRNGNDKARNFQVESNPNVFNTVNGKTLREAIKRAMLSLAKTEA